MKVRPSGGKYLKAETLGRDFYEVVRILRVVEENIQGERRPVMYFEGHDRGLVLRSTTIQTLLELFGTDESDHWLGRRIEMFTTLVDYQGKRQLGIRLRPPTTSSGDPQPRRPREEEPPRGRVPGEDDEPLHASKMRW